MVVLRVPNLFIFNFNIDEEIFVIYNCFNFPFSAFVAIPSLLYVYCWRIDAI